MNEKFFMSTDELKIIIEALKSQIEYLKTWIEETKFYDYEEHEYLAVKEREKELLDCRALLSKALQNIVK